MKNPEFSPAKFVVPLAELKVKKPPTKPAK